jgi:hypothetical protein
MANEKQYLTELEFDTAYRPATAEMYEQGMKYFHKVKYTEGYVAEEAGIHENLDLDRVQFTEDAFKRLAYLPASSFEEETRTVKEVAESRSFDIMYKGGEEVAVDTPPTDEGSTSKKTKSKKEAQATQDS